MADRNQGNGRLKLLGLLLRSSCSSLVATRRVRRRRRRGAAPPAPPAETAAPADTGAATGAATSEGEGTPIKIGHPLELRGAVRAVLRPDGGWRELPLIDRGATPVEPRSDEGRRERRVAGHPVEIVYGCSDATPDKALYEARRLVEQEGVDILIGPLSGSEGIAVAEYSKEQPRVTFVNGTPARRTRRSRSSRRTSSASTTTARSGRRASATTPTTTLGWRNVVTIGDDYDFPYTQIAGFVAEFCSLGGKMTQRLWPPLGEEDYSSYIAQIPERRRRLLPGRRRYRHGCVRQAVRAAQAATSPTRSWAASS